MNAFVNQITRVAGWTQWRSHSYTIYFFKYLLLNVKNDTLVIILNKLLKSCLGMLEGFSLPLCRLSMQILMLLPSGTFVNKKSTSRLATCKLGSC